MKNGATEDGTHAPWYVAHKDLVHNTLHVVQGHNHAWLQSPWLQAQDLSWVAGHAPEAGRYAAKTRYRQTDAACVLSLVNSEAVRLDFDQAQWAVTPGQSAVLYDGDVCLGGGVIHAAQTPQVVAAVPLRKKPATSRRRQVLSKAAV